MREMGQGERRDDGICYVERAGVYVYCVFLNDDDAENQKEMEKAIAICLVVEVVMVWVEL